MEDARGTGVVDAIRLPIEVTARSVVFVCNDIYVTVLRIYA